MKSTRQFQFTLLSLLTVAAAASSAAETVTQTSDISAWPEITKECRPWTYWWWLGSAVSEAELTRHLQAYREAGMGGVHIVPIYSAKGYEDRAIPYLTPEWMKKLKHTINEGERLDLGVDMTVGTGWPYGGPWVGADDAAARVFFETYSSSDERLQLPLQAKDQPEARLQALMAVSTSGESQEITHRVDGEGKLNWQAPSEDWTVYAVFQGWSKQQVKRAVPGAEGNVLDYFSKDKLQHYLSRFDEAFTETPPGQVRAFYNDSYEVYGANWTDDLFDEFQTRRGYDLKTELPTLLGEGEPERVSRVRCDYRETVFNLLLEDFTQPWVEWSHAKGGLTRDQAHGSPGNLIDLYSAADIPETEGFGPAGAEILVAKFASSASHLNGKPLTSSESCTWLGEHFQVSLSQVKPAIDTLFLSGINHVFYHGMPFSPADVPFPGWLFYASVHFGLTNTFHRDFPELNRYIARCQSLLQSGQPDEDLLLYVPIYDLWSDERGSKDFLQYCTVHNADSWFKTVLQPTYETAEYLWKNGYAFDYVSDRILQHDLQAGADGSVQTAHQSYRAIVVAGCRLMPDETLAALLRMAENGARILFLGSMPEDVPGLGNYEQRHDRFKNLMATIEFSPADQDGIQSTKLGKGLIQRSDRVDALSAATEIPRETMTDMALEFIRRKTEDGVIYFIVNRSKKDFAGSIPVSVPFKSVVKYDPMNGSSGMVETHRSERNHISSVRLAADASIILKVCSDFIGGEPAWPFYIPSDPIFCFTNPWNVTFLEGGPELPQPWVITELKLWNERKDQASTDFSGTARYQTVFTKPTQSAKGWLLELGEIHESARVTLNGKYVGTLWHTPNRLDITSYLKDGENALEVEVTNLMANRIAAMDRAKIPWQSFFFVNINYKPFDTSDWKPLPSGLAGPVALIPLVEPVE